MTGTGTGLGRRTFVIFFCFTNDFFFGAIVRWPFLGARAEGLLRGSLVRWGSRNGNGGLVEVPS